MSGQQPTCFRCGHKHTTYGMCYVAVTPDVDPNVWAECCTCEESPLSIVTHALAEANDQIRKLQDSANRRLDEYREVTAFLREVINRLQVEAYFHGNRNTPGGCLCPTCNILHRAEVMNLR